MGKEEKSLRNVVTNENLKYYTLKKSLQQNIDLFKNIIFFNDDSIVYRVFKNRTTGLKFCLIFVEGMTDKKIVNENIIFELISNTFTACEEDVLKYIQEEVVIVDETKISCDTEQIVSSILYGSTLLIVEGLDKGLILNTLGWKTRAIDEPQSETILSGPREGFNESISINISLIRRRINSPSLKFEFSEIGVRTKTKICIAYMEDIVQPKILQEVRNRLSQLDIEGIFSANSLKEFIKDDVLSPFKTVGTTERPDVVASKMLQGRIAILGDGSPVVLTVPYLFVEHFQIDEDYYENFTYASVNRIIRIIAFILTISASAIYIAFTTFHKELIPTKLAMSIYASRQGVPLPAALETFVMLIMFEIIREAGIRLPKHIGSAVSIVGALVLGDAAVNAKFVSSPVVIVTAITGISELVLYEMRACVIIIRIIFLIFASFFGIYGVIFSTMGLFIHLMATKSFGIPYMLKFIDLNNENIRDSAIRSPWNILKYRTKFICKDRIRIKNYKKRRNK
ncbi:spore germination protein [Hathewaya limosa]|uniref:Spore germination protein KA n=1 Tax=Hathewaya limosa TaxID=1536 RepID=A0ABU0JR74_HATLI|nr:spore germination protein [Hathewaya limosa]MDQ0479598.1 spore germination protein KA [Hathewaya limosa]